MPSKWTVYNRLLTRIQSIGDISALLLNITIFGTCLVTLNCKTMLHVWLVLHVIDKRGSIGFVLKLNHLSSIFEQLSSRILKWQLCFWTFTIYCARWVLKYRLRLKCIRRQYTRVCYTVRKSDHCQQISEDWFSTATVFISLVEFIKNVESRTLRLNLVLGSVVLFCHEESNVHCLRVWTSSASLNYLLILIATGRDLKTVKVWPR